MSKRAVAHGPAGSWPRHVASRGFARRATRALPPRGCGRGVWRHAAARAAPPALCSQGPATAAAPSHSSLEMPIHALHITSPSPPNARRPAQRACCGPLAAACRLSRRLGTITHTSPAWQSSGVAAEANSCHRTPPTTQSQHFHCALSARACAELRRLRPPTTAHVRHHFYVLEPAKRTDNHLRGKRNIQPESPAPWPPIEHCLQVCCCQKQAGWCCGSLFNHRFKGVRRRGACEMQHARRRAPGAVRLASVIRDRR